MTADIAYAIAILASSALAWDFGKRWLATSAQSRLRSIEVQVLTQQLEELRAELVTSDDIRNKLATDWQKKFSQLEHEWKKVREHGISQVAGTLAQLETQQRHGFGR
jgi:hypothetical protein